MKLNQNRSLISAGEEFEYPLVQAAIRQGSWVTKTVPFSGKEETVQCNKEIHRGMDSY